MPRAIREVDSPPRPSRPPQEARATIGNRNSARLRARWYRCWRTAVVVAGVGMLAAGMPATAVATVASATPSATAAGWHATEAPQPSAAVTAVVSDVTCLSATKCVADLTYTHTIGGVEDQALLTGAGTKWSLAKSNLTLPADVGPEGGYLRFTCFSAALCVGVGFYQSRAGYQSGLIVSGHGTTWSAIKAPLPANAAKGTVNGQEPAADVWAVACPAASRCLAVGSYTDNAGASEGMFLAGFGSKWTATQAPGSGNAGFTSSAIWSITCSAASRCLSAGYYSSASSAYEAAMFTWSGTTWVRGSVAPPTPPGMLALSESCPSATGCGALFLFSDASSSGSDVLMVTATSAGWQLVRAPLPAGGAIDPDGSYNGAAFECLAGGHCFWAMTYSTAKEDQAIVLDAGYGANWKAIALKSPADAAVPQSPNLVVSALACASASACVIAGEYADKSGDGEIFLLTQHGSSWTSGRAPVPANASQVPSGTMGAYGPPQVDTLTCVSATECVAGGSYPLRSSLAGLLLTGPA